MIILNSKRTIGFACCTLFSQLCLCACPESQNNSPPPKKEASPFQNQASDAGNASTTSNHVDSGTPHINVPQDAGAPQPPSTDGGSSTDMPNDAGPLPPCELISVDGGMNDSGFPQIDTDNDSAPDDCDPYPEHHNDDIQFITDLINNSELGITPLQLGSQTWTAHRLTHLYCDDAHLTGPIPSSMGNVTQLVNLVLSNNNLTGEIPLGMATLTHLNQLELGYNLLSGPLPAELGEITTLTFLSVSDNALMGTLPETLSNLSALHTLRVDQNNFIGPIPDSYVNLSNLEFLWVHGNELTGVIPSGLCDLENIVTLMFGANEFCPPYPTCTAVDLGPQNTNNCADDN